MIKNVLGTIQDVQVYPIVALFLFLFVFAGAIVVALAMTSGDAAARCRMPLEDSNPTDTGAQT